MMRIPSRHDPPPSMVGVMSDRPCDMRAPKRGELNRAEVMLRPWVGYIVDAYLRAGMAKLARTEWEITDEVRDDDRHFARCSTDGELIGFAPETILLPEATIQGVIAHEFGHAADFLYPGQFMLTYDDDPLVERVSSSRKSRRDWASRDYDEIERTADGIAEMVLGVSIRYAGSCMLETFGAGVRPRPVGLR